MDVDFRALAPLNLLGERATYPMIRPPKLGASGALAAKAPRPRTRVRGLGCSCQPAR
jgi:hypothetical protein